MKRLILSLVCVCSVIVSNAHASLLVEQGKIKKVVRPGQTVQGKLVLHNMGNVPIIARVYFEDFEYIEPFKGEKEFLAAGTSQYSCADWINFYPKQATLPAHASEDIQYTISVPEDAQGGKYGVLFFERELVQPDTDSQVGLTIVSRVGTLVFVETADRIKSLKFESVEASDDGVSVAVQNTSNIFLVASPVFYIMDSEGIPVSRGKTDARYLSVGSSTDINFTIDPEILPGQYSAVVTFDLEDGIAEVLEIEFQKTAHNTFEILNYRN